VAGGLFPICTGGDGGGSIRIPAGFTGLFGLKATFGRIPKGPHTEIEPLTAVIGCLSRSVRDTARWYDVCNGADEYDPFSLPRVEGWEAGLGGQDLGGKRVAVSVDLGGAVVAAGVREKVEEAADLLIKDAGLERVDVPIALPKGGLEWALAGTASLLVGLGDLYPACESELTPEIMLAANIATNHYNVDTAKNIEAFRRAIIVQMAQIFEQVDFVICATNPDVAFGAQGPMPTVVDGVDLIAELGFEAALGNNGALTIPANTTGHPAAAIPIGTVGGLPVSMQIIGRRHAEPLLLDLARVVEQERPWPLVAPGAPV
jgi:aspartyl-tRNA(Asn)/glutamyl-tRNA(Gln) amidotransferase subunit A